MIVDRDNGDVTILEKKPKTVYNKWNGQMRDQISMYISDGIPQYEINKIVRDVFLKKFWAGKKNNIAMRNVKVGYIGNKVVSVEPKAVFVPRYSIGYYKRQLEGIEKVQKYIETWEMETYVFVLEGINTSPYGIYNGLKGTMTKAKKLATKLRRSRNIKCHDVIWYPILLGNRWFCQFLVVGGNKKNLKEYLGSHNILFNKNMDIKKFCEAMSKTWDIANKECNIQQALLTIYGIQSWYHGLWTSDRIKDDGKEDFADTKSVGQKGVGIDEVEADIYKNYVLVGDERHTAFQSFTPDIQIAHIVKELLGERPISDILRIPGPKDPRDYYNGMWE